MHSQEPWQSRSPTGSVNKPLISSTLMKTGRRGPNHSYGRGLPVKRKALIILSIAILAFAMIPALGAGAAAGDVKIVTPDQLADPDETTGAAFTRLTGAAYVSDQTGSTENLEDAGGTLYVVIDDNDSQANSLTGYNAFFLNIPGAADGGSLFRINPADAGTDGASPYAADVTNPLNSDGEGTLVGDFLSLGDDSARDLDTEAEADRDDITAELQVLDSLVVGDEDRSGTVDGADIALELGWYRAPVRGNPDAVPPTADVPAHFVGTRLLRNVNAFAGISRAGDGLYLDRSFIPALDDTTSIPTDDQPQLPDGGGADTAYSPALRIGFSSAGENTLAYPDDFRVEALQGLSRVQVSSTSDDEGIRIAASEKSLATYREEIGGVSAAAFGGNDISSFEPANADSRDSGTFVGRFGVIRNAFKTAIATWSPSPTDTVYADDDADTDNNAAEFEVGGVGGPTAATADGTTNLATTTLTISGFDADNVLKADSVGVVVVTDRTTQGTPDDPQEIQVESFTVGDANASGEIEITVITEATGATATNGSTQAPDTFSVSYTVTALNNNISDMLIDLRATEAGVVYDEDDGQYAFRLLCDTSKPLDDQCEDRDALEVAISGDTNTNGHMANLSLTGDDDATALSDLLVGVQHGDRLTVSYDDESAGSRSTSTEVDLVAPSVGSITPGNNSYIDDDSFSVLFDVTDNDSGILEDSHDTRSAEIKSGLAYVSSRVFAEVGQDPTTSSPQVDDDNDRDKILDQDDTLSNGERYELEIDVGDEAQTTAAKGSANQAPKTVRVLVEITAYDAARNKYVRSLRYIVDDIDPVLTKAFTGYTIKADATADTGEGGFVLSANNQNGIVLVFDDAVAGDVIRTQDVNILGSSALAVTWLNNSGNNAINTTGLDASLLNDLGLSSGTKVDSRHLLFVELSDDIGTGDRPTVEIDGDDLTDLAGNTNRSDHQATPTDRIEPTFTVTVENALSNDSLNIIIESSEDLERTPSAFIERPQSTDPPESRLNRPLTPRSGAANTWTVAADRSGLNLNSRAGTEKGIYTITVSGVDEAGNQGTNAMSKWELDTKANAPTREGGNENANVVQSLETNEVIFLTMNFDAEAGEYAGDSTNKSVSIDGLSLESLASDAFTGTPPSIKADATVESTTDLDAGSAQTSNGVRHVVALSELGLGNYRLNVDFSDQAGNAGKFGYVFRVVAPAPAEVNVVPGWSLVSIPGTPQDVSIGGVLEGSAVTDVWSLNNETKVWEFARIDENGEWMGTLSQIVDGRGYFVRSTTFDPISVLIERFSPQRTPPQYLVTSGWNSIGYTPAGGEKAISADAYLSALGASGWGMIRTWNANATQYETYFSSGVMTAGFPVGDGQDAGATGADADDVGLDIAKVEVGKGYLLFATRNGQIGG